MAEALGIISSTITICDLVYKLRKCCKRINAAPAVWEEYCEKLERLSHVQSVLTDMISGQTPAFNGRKGKELATLAAREIRTIEKQVKNILGGHDKWVKSSGNRIWDWLRVKRTSTKFVIVEEDLRGLIKSAEKAKVSLHSAICLCGLEALDAGQTEMRHAFRRVHKSMKEQAEAMERLNRDMKLSSIPFHILDRKGRHVKPPVRREIRGDTSRYESKRSSRRSNEGGASARQEQSRTKVRHDSGEITEAVDDYELVLRDGEVLIVATDTDEYKSEAGGIGTEMQSTDLIRIERTLEDINEDVWERGKGNHLYEFQLSLAEDSSSFNTDVSDDTMPILVDSDKQSRAFVDEGTNLSQCGQSETKSMLFCVSHIWINETNQTLTIREPCLQPCHHVELRFLNEILTARKLPIMIDFKFINRVIPLGETVGYELAWYFTLQSYHRCPDGWPCSHTLIGGALPWQDGITPQKVVCLVPGNLEASICDYGWEPDSATQNTELARDDDDCALNLLQKVKRKDHTIPARISFRLLVGYLRLIEGLPLEEEYLLQCYIWTDAIISEVSTSFDEEAMAWAWVLWKLRRGTEFKRLTGIIQQQGKHLVSQETDRYGVILPQRIIGAIDQKRISVLSQIRDLVQNSIETGRCNYKITRTQDDPGWTAPLKIMSSSLMVGYLTLEYETFLLDGRTWDDGNFDGVSFADASGWIRSMMDLGNWMAKPVSPPVHTMPFALSGLMTLFPTVGVRVYEATVSTYLSSDVYKTLIDLVKRLEEEGDWGVDLIDE